MTGIEQDTSYKAMVEALARLLARMDQEDGLPDNEDPYPMKKEHTSSSNNQFLHSSSHPEPSHKPSYQSTCNTVEKHCISFSGNVKPNHADRDQAKLNTLSDTINDNHQTSNKLRQQTRVLSSDNIPLTCSIADDHGTVSQILDYDSKVNSLNPQVQISSLPAESTNTSSAELTDIEKMKTKNNHNSTNNCYQTATEYDVLTPALPSVSSKELGDITLTPSMLMRAKNGVYPQEADAQHYVTLAHSNAQLDGGVCSVGVAFNPSQLQSIYKVNGVYSDHKQLDKNLLGRQIDHLSNYTCNSKSCSDTRVLDPDQCQDDISMTYHTLVNKERTEVSTSSQESILSWQDCHSKLDSDEEDEYGGLLEDNTYTTIASRSFEYSTTRKLEDVEVQSNSSVELEERCCNAYDDGHEIRIDTYGDYNPMDNKWKSTVTMNQEHKTDVYPYLNISRQWSWYPYKKNDTPGKSTSPRRRKMFTNSCSKHLSNKQKENTDIDPLQCGDCEECSQYIRSLKLIIETSTQPDLSSKAFLRKLMQSTQAPMLVNRVTQDASHFIVNKELTSNVNMSGDDVACNNHMTQLTFNIEDEILWDQKPDVVTETQCITEQTHIKPSEGFTTIAKKIVLDVLLNSIARITVTVIINNAIQSIHIADYNKYTSDNEYYTPVENNIPEVVYEEMESTSTILDTNVNNKLTLEYNTPAEIHDINNDIAGIESEEFYSTSIGEYDLNVQSLSSTNELIPSSSKLKESDIDNYALDKQKYTPVEIHSDFESDTGECEEVESTPSSRPIDTDLINTLTLKDNDDFTAEYHMPVGSHDIKDNILEKESEEFYSTSIGEYDLNVQSLPSTDKLLPSSPKLEEINIDNYAPEKEYYTQVEIHDLEKDTREEIESATTIIDTSLVNTLPDNCDYTLEYHMNETREVESDELRSIGEYDIRTEKTVSNATDLNVPSLPPGIPMNDSGLSLSDITFNSLKFMKGKLLSIKHAVQDVGGDYGVVSPVAHPPTELYDDILNTNDYISCDGTVKVPTQAHSKKHRNTRHERSTIKRLTTTCNCCKKYICKLDERIHLVKNDHYTTSGEDSIVGLGCPMKDTLLQTSENVTPVEDVISHQLVSSTKLKLETGGGIMTHDGVNTEATSSNVNKEELIGTDEFRTGGDVEPACISTKIYVWEKFKDFRPLPKHEVAVTSPETPTKERVKYFEGLSINNIEESSFDGQYQTLNKYGESQESQETAPLSAITKHEKLEENQKENSGSFTICQAFFDALYTPASTTSVDNQSSNSSFTTNTADELLSLSGNDETCDYNIKDTYKEEILEKPARAQIEGATGTKVAHSEDSSEYEDNELEELSQQKSVDSIQSNSKSTTVNNNDKKTPFGFFKRLFTKKKKHKTLKKRNEDNERANTHEIQTGVDQARDEELGFDIEWEEEVTAIENIVVNNEVICNNTDECGKLKDRHTVALKKRQLNRHPSKRSSSENSRDTEGDVSKDRQQISKTKLRNEGTTCKNETLNKASKKRIFSSKRAFTGNSKDIEEGSNTNFKNETRNQSPKKRLFSLKDAKQSQSETVSKSSRHRLK